MLSLVADGAVENQNSHWNRATHGWSKRPRQAATAESVGEKVDTLNDHFVRACFGKNSCDFSPTVLPT